MKRVVIISMLLILANCAYSEVQKEKVKTAKSHSGSCRINASEMNAENSLKDL